MSDDKGLPSVFVGPLCESLRKGGGWWNVAQEVFSDELPLNDPKAWGELLDMAFFASLTTEEGHRARFSMALVKPQRFPSEYTFQPEQPLTVENLRKLSAACDKDATRLRVWFRDGAWFIGGIALNERPPRRGSTFRNVEMSKLTLSVRDVGVLRLRWEHHILFTYKEGRGEVVASDDRVGEFIQQYLPKPPKPTSMVLALHHLSSIYRSMKAHGRGGALLVVPNDPPSIEFRYRMPRYYPEEGVGGILFYDNPLSVAALREERLRREAPESDDPTDEFSFQRLQQAAIEATDAEAALIGRFTAVDGIVVIDHALCVRGFGGKIAVPDDFELIELIHINPKDWSRSRTTVQALFSGMRHKSAAAICKAAGPNALVLVQSQDGALTVIVNSANELLVLKPLDRLIPFFEY